MKKEKKSVSDLLFGRDYDAARNEGKEEGYQNGFEDGVEEGYKNAKHEFEDEITILKNKISELEKEKDND